MEPLGVDEEEEEGLKIAYMSALVYFNEGRKGLVVVGGIHEKWEEGSARKYVEGSLHSKKESLIVEVFEGGVWREHWKCIVL